MKLGALTYRTRNLGDDVQTISAMQYLEPEVFIDRDKIATEEMIAKLKEKVANFLEDDIM